VGLGRMLSQNGVPKAASGWCGFMGQYGAS
jgi:hypothetical protein